MMETESQFDIENQGSLENVEITEMQDQKTVIVIVNEQGKIIPEESEEDDGEEFIYNFLFYVLLFLGIVIIGTIVHDLSYGENMEEIKFLEEEAKKLQEQRMNALNAGKTWEFQYPLNNAYEVEFKMEFENGEKLPVRMGYQGLAVWNLYTATSQGDYLLLDQVQFGFNDHYEILKTEVSFDDLVKQKKSECNKNSTGPIYFWGRYDYIENPKYTENSKDPKELPYVLAGYDPSFPAANAIIEKDSQVCENLFSIIAKDYQNYQTFLQSQSTNEPQNRSPSKNSKQEVQGMSPTKTKATNTYSPSKTATKQEVKQSVNKKVTKAFETNKRLSLNSGDEKAFATITYKNVETYAVEFDSKFLGYEANKKHLIRFDEFNKWNPQKIHIFKRYWLHLKDKVTDKESWLNTIGYIGLAICFWIFVAVCIGGLTWAYKHHKLNYYDDIMESIGLAWYIALSAKFSFLFLLLLSILEFKMTEEDL